MHLPVAFCSAIVDRLQLAHVGGPTLKPVFERSHLFLRCDEMRLHLHNLLALLRLGRAEAVEILCNVEEPWGDAVELVDEGADSGHDAPQLHRLHAAADEGARRRPCRPELQVGASAESCTPLRACSHNSSMTWMRFAAASA
eukprot:CAMPEP_0177489540 /NCGR_PEP_ID=MMETSP0369-20130122/30757_1 /TAXON_ID=447022 ORGANISM="Scrippsiella hangoei-like, Strain SHHI-4" /NCGR_SAMPLE_ID=MMETSP0369 /ASSEMBLY_ACC=CAM_ASM_000364 /LENGTH=141 /DNA_ID=CAMNT_0018966009 /DNA_START=87 /DNA_END=509 /DNA_ORIENTATION=+